MASVIGLTAKFLPLSFAFGFVVPVIAESMAALGWTGPFGLSPLSFALIVGFVWGMVAQIKGRWI